MPLSPPTRRLVSAAVVLAILLVAARLTFFRGFDADAWQSVASQQDSHEADFRRGMYLDLKLLGGLKGKSRQEVIDLLGSPATRHDLKGHEMVYGMGIDRTLKKVWLVLDFEDHVVARVGRVRSD